MLLFLGGDEMKDLFQHLGAVETKDTYDEALKKIRTGLQNCTNSVVQRNLLFLNFPQDTKSFEKWLKEISNAKKTDRFHRLSLETSRSGCNDLKYTKSKIERERALQENVKYDELIKLGIAKQQSQKGAAMLASAQDPPQKHGNPRKLDA